MDYESLVVTTCAVMVGSTEANSVANGKGLVGKPVVAGFGLGVFLFIIGIARQDLGSKFCWFIMITALLVNGGPLFKALAGGTQTATTTYNSNGSVKESSPNIPPVSMPVAPGFKGKY